MTIKNSPNVTITLARTTVAMLRAKKRGLETWDELMRRLGSKRRCGIECLICGVVVETTDAEVSPSMLAKTNGWRGVYSRKVTVDNMNIKTMVELGYICPSCGDST